MGIENILEQLIARGSRLTPKQIELLDKVPAAGAIHSSALAKKLRISEPALRRRINGIERVDAGILGKKKAKDGFDISLNVSAPAEPQTLEAKLPDNPHKVHVKNLYMGEMGFGTKAYDPDAMTGLRYFLQYNGGTGITNVMMLGAMIPRVPEFYSVSGSEDMRFLAKDPTKPASEAVEIAVQKAELRPSDVEYFREHVDGKIKTRQDAVNAARAELEKLAEILAGAEWHYQHGEEDRENIKIAKELMIADAAEKKKNFKQYTDEIKKLETKLERLQKQAEGLTNELPFMQYMSRRLKETKEKTGDELRQYVSSMLESKAQEFSLDTNAKDEIFKMIAQKSLTTKQLLDRADRLKDATAQLAKDEEEIKQQIAGNQQKIDGVKRQKEFWDFFRGTKRHKLEPDEEEIFFRITKTTYNDMLYGVFPGAIRAKSHIHSSAFNELTDPLSNGNAKAEPVVGDAEEYVAVKSESGLIYMLAHNPNMLGSNTATAKDLRMLKDEIKRLVKLTDILEIPIPDVTLSSHGRGGFRYQPQMKFRETIMAGQNRLVPETVVHFKLPTLQSMPKLEVLRTKGLRNVHTKRYNDGSYASGVVFHTMYENGRFEVEYLDESTLRFLAGIGKAIDETKAALGKEGLKEEDKPKLESELKEFERIMRFTSDLSKTESDGDSHLSSANEPGRRSNYEIVDAVQRFQRAYGLPDLVVISEAIHAPIPGVCNTNEQYMGLTPKKFENRLEAIVNGHYSPEEKIRRLKQVAIEQVHATPITHIDAALGEWKDRCLPYMLEVLQKGGRVAIASGNHYNKAGSGRDEAIAIANMIPPGFEKQVEAFHAKGDTIGCGETTLPGGKKLYASHKLREGNDEFVNAFRQIQGQGIDADLVLFFDRHHGGGGFADGTAYTLAPGRQTWNRYVDQISKLSSAAGIVNTYLPKDERIRYVKWEWALSDCLEKHFMEPRIEDQTLLERNPNNPEKPKSHK